MSLRARVSRGLKSLEKPFAVHNTIRVSRSALLNNFDLFEQLSPGKLVIPVLKANAYGHGIEQVAQILKERIFPYLAVDGYFEALQIRAVSRQPVLVMGAIAPENFQGMKFGNFAFVVGDQAAVEALGKTGKRVRVHLEVDTGMTRYGFATSELPNILAVLKRYPGLELEGIMSHLADADNPSDRSYTDEQVRRFDAAVEQVREAGFAPKYLHVAQSAGSTKARSKYANTLRVGIAMYGILPLSDQDPALGVLKGLKPVLELRSTITKVLEVKAGTKVSYGCTFTAARDSRIGVLPLGYYEGIPWALSGKGQVKVADGYAPMAGRVCMDHTMIDLTDSKAKVGDQAVVINPERGDPVSLDAVAARHQLFNYEMLVRLNHSIRRLICD